MRSRSSDERQLSFSWVTPRPAYMREIEPLAHPDAWSSLPSGTGTWEPLLTPEQLRNRQLFRDGRKEVASSESRGMNERKTG